MYIKSFNKNDELIGAEKLDPVCWIRYQVDNDMIVRCEPEEAQGVVSETGEFIYFMEGIMPKGEKELWYVEITEEEYNSIIGEDEDPEDENPQVPDGQSADELPTRAELAERVAALEEQNDFLSECLLEMSEVVYA